jgi:hypothetical protein
VYAVVDVLFVVSMDDGWLLDLLDMEMCNQIHAAGTENIVFLCHVLTTTAFLFFLILGNPELY